MCWSFAVEKMMSPSRLYLHENRKVIRQRMILEGRDGRRAEGALVRVATREVVVVDGAYLICVRARSWPASRMGLMVLAGFWLSRCFGWSREGSVVGGFIIADWGAVGLLVHEGCGVRSWEWDKDDSGAFKCAVGFLFGRVVV